MSRTVAEKEHFTFPKEIILNLIIGGDSENASAEQPQQTQCNVTLHSGLTILIGPNGSGKTHILRALQANLGQVAENKYTRFISAGRIGMTEQYRAVLNTYDSQPNYERAQFGSYDSRTLRHRVETLEGDYQTIVERPDIQLKVRERLKKLFNRDIFLKWHNGSLKVEFSSEASGGERYSAAREASGLVHLAGLLSAIYDDQIGVLLLDEPEVSLHPQLQAFLLREITSVAGAPGERNKKIVIISTHSTEFLKVDHPGDLPNLIFTTSVSDNPVQIKSGAPELGNRKVAELISRMGQEHKLSFFAKSPLLVEGPSDSIICTGLCNKLGIYVEAGGSQVLPVVGKGQFPVVVKLLKMMGKNPIVLADADAFTDGNELVQAFSDSEPANQAAISMSHDSISKMYAATQTAFTKMVQENWEDIRLLAENTLYWKNRGDSDDELKLKRRSAFSAMFSNEMAVLQPAYMAMRSRLTSVLEALEKGGCYILRRGTIESYYKTQVENLEGKPGAATEEVIAFKQDQATEVEDRYSDVVRCLKRAARAENIEEAELLQEALVAILAPLVAKIRDSDEVNISRLLKSIDNSLAGLFDITYENDDLIVQLKSDILDVDCFPLRIDPKDDVITTISKGLRSGRK